jgi:DNA-binding response OmpR family regulator
MSSRSDDAGSFFYVLEDPVRILFADDDPILREFAVVHLSTQTARIDTAEDGAVALECLETNPCDVLLLDLEMPRVDGFEVLKQLRASERFCRLPVIVVTGREDVAAIDRAYAAGASSFIVKPINWRLLSYQIRFIHRNARAEANLLEARSRARADACVARATLRRLASEGLNFLTRALRQSPELRPAAQVYAAALEAASGADEDRTASAA